ncbi:acyl carrier protein, partial [Acinetobacter baumannii]
KIDRKALKQTAQEFLYQTYAQTASSKNTQVFDSKMNLQKDSPKYHRHSKQSDLARPSIAQEVIEHLQRSLPSQQESSDVLLDTEILALGMTSGHLSRLAKHLSQQLNTAIQLSDLAKCKTVGE